MGRSREYPQPHRASQILLDKKPSARHLPKMEKWDHGLGVIGLIGLAVLLAVIIPLGTIKAPDWLGFAGSVFSSLVALGAATVAWGAVQRQIGVQQEANLLGILTREEDRIESELHALTACFELLLKARQARKRSDPMQYLRYLRENGVVGDLATMKGRIRELTQADISPLLLHECGMACASLMTEIERCVQAKPNPDRAGGLIYDPHISQEVRTAEAQLDSQIKAIDQRQVQLLALLPRYRRRIEAGLREAL